MSEGQTLLLGLIAGATVFLGLPLGRIRTARAGLRQFLSALAAGILIFLLWDVLAHAYAPIDQALARVHSGGGGLDSVVGYSALFFGGIAVGLMALVYYERWLNSRGRRAAFGPGAMAPEELHARRLGIAGWSPARRLSLMIAVGMGLHNVGEGLAIGASAASGAIALAVVLVIGFGLHNATEGFGIVGPLAAETQRPSWAFLGLMGLIAGGPTFVGTAVGRLFQSQALTVVFLSLAAGSILYVIVQLIGVGLKHGRREVLFWGILLGLMLGFLTDMVVTAGGG
jgi:zinc transporter, ZIP family